MVQLGPFVGLAVVVALAAIASLISGSMWGLERQVDALKRMSSVTKDNVRIQTLDPEEAIQLVVGIRKNAAILFFVLLGVVTVAGTAVHLSSQLSVETSRSIKITSEKIVDEKPENDKKTGEKVEQVAPQKQSDLPPKR